MKEIKINKDLNNDDRKQKASDMMFKFMNLWDWEFTVEFVIIEI